MAPGECRGPLRGLHRSGRLGVPQPRRVPADHLRVLRPRGDRAAGADRDRPPCPPPGTAVGIPRGGHPRDGDREDRRCVVDLLPRRAGRGQHPALVRAVQVRGPSRQVVRSVRPEDELHRTVRTSQCAADVGHDPAVPVLAVQRRGQSAEPDRLPRFELPRRVDPGGVHRAHLCPRGRGGRVPLQIGLTPRRLTLSVFEPPRVLSAQALLDKAFRRATKATTGKGRTREERTKNLEVAKVQAAGDVLANTIETYIKGFPSLDRIPPFYRELIEATIGVAALRKNLAGVDWGRKKVLELARGFARRIQAAHGTTAVGAVRREAFGRFSSVIEQISANLEGLEEARRPLKNFPDIDPENPTIVVAGYPNVGKSAFVARVSTAKPRVAPYPFTTQGVLVGHFDVGYTRFQILDTPGLLDRPMDRRNPMERQAIAALAHVAGAVVFILDPSETCGYELSVQQHLLDTVRELFPAAQILVVENKADLRSSGLGRPSMSALTGVGVPEVLAEAVRSATSRAPAVVPPGRAG